VNDGNEITLAEAIERARARDAVAGNSYDWYRKQAAMYGEVHIGDQRVRAIKRGRQWVVNERELTESIAGAAAAKTAKHEAERQAGEDYEARKLNPKGARTTWGGYSVRGDFHFVWSDYAIMRQRSNGGWVCNRCWEPASTEHDKAECHRCSDWGPCGTDCTLSRIYCQACATSMAA
jgi:hypothetical protein